MLDVFFLLRTYEVMSTSTTQQWLIVKMLVATSN